MPFSQVVWAVDGTPMPRNPDSQDFKFDKANVQYETLANGRQVRVEAPYLISGSDLVLGWKFSDRRLLNYLSQFFNPPTTFPRTPHKLTVDGMQPPVQAYVHFDTPAKTGSSEVFSRRSGEGGVRYDLTLTLRMTTPHLRSLNPIPLATPTVAQVKAWFGGHLGSAMDFIPTWNGVGWNIPIVAGNAGGALPSTISNLGMVPWNPTIKMNGPFTALSWIFQGVDVDGTGGGLKFSWGGGAVANGDYLLFDTVTKRCWAVISGVKSEVNTFTFVTASDNIPFSFFPGFPSGTVGSINPTVTGYGAATSIDLSNNGVEAFGYLF